MIESILRLAINRRYLVLSLLMVIIGVGMWSYQKLPIDAVPDITNVQVQINTSAPGYSPLEAEQRRYSLWLRARNGSYFYRAWRNIYVYSASFS
jgi:Cu/Ag efflux pump CusA